MVAPIPSEEEVSIVLAGKFETNNFDPQNLLNVGVLMPHEARSAHLYRKLFSTGSGFQIKGITLFAAPNKLNLETHDTSQSDRLRDIVLGILHHEIGVPSQACGINYEFFYILPDYLELEQVMFQTASIHQKWGAILEQPRVRQFTVSGLRTGPFPGENNVTVRPWKRKGHGIAVAVNYHFPMPREVDVSQLRRLASEFLEQEWSPALAFASRVSKLVFANGYSHAI